MSFTFGDLELANGPRAAPTEPGVLTSVRIPMPDGVELVGDLYLPQASGRCAAIVTRTPYGAAALGPLGKCYAAHGYMFLAVDVRGRFRSGGTWDPGADEASDGPATIAWLAARPECDGRVATRGQSYAAANQLLAAPAVGDALCAMTVVSSPADAFDNVPFQGGAYELSDWEWAWQQSAPVSYSPPGDEDETDEAIDARLREALSARPLIDADLRLGLRSPIIRQWLDHWKFDRYWQQRAWLPRLARCRVPTLHIAGWWDNNARGSVLAFQAMGGAKGGQRLLIGPWEHCLDAPVVDDLLPFEQAHVRRAAQRDVWTDELAWFEHHLQGQPQRSAVAEIFVTGAWRWLEWPDWPPPDSAIVPWYLGADGGVSAKVPTRGQRQFEFDPGCPNTIAAARRFPIEPFPYNTVPDERDDVLVYRSTPLDSGMLLAGDVVVELRASSTARDCDWVARLVDEYPDGRAICIRDGVLRSRFRNGFARPRLLTPGKRAAFHIELWQVAHWFRPGHRLRVEIASSALGRWDVNPQNGGDLARSSTLVVAQHTVYSGRGGTRILLPICAGAEQSCAL